MEKEGAQPAGGQRRAETLFTGIIESIGRVNSVAKQGKVYVLTIGSTLDLSDTKVGDSVSVDGVCLTVVGISGDSFSVEATPETLTRSTLRSADKGVFVNLERALRLTDRLGGHLVQGHVEGIGGVRRVTQNADGLIIEIDADSSITRYVIDKGSVAVDGISLTVNSLTRTGFTVNIIGHTEEKTTLRQKRPGSEVNIETDIIGRYIERLLTVQKSQGTEGLTMTKLAQEGYV
ncbi:MAG: riboflavin synthase [Deltaproteobacteria bacterium]|nr:riboflavin synthase [Candidatus Zymogenaceae bacterium]